MIARNDFAQSLAAVSHRSCKLWPIVGRGPAKKWSCKIAMVGKICHAAMCSLAPNLHFIRRNFCCVRHRCPMFVEIELRHKELPKLQPPPGAVVDLQRGTIWLSAGSDLSGMPGMLGWFTAVLTEHLDCSPAIAAIRFKQLLKIKEAKFTGIAVN